jgi:hypothetical protein
MLTLYHTAVTVLKSAHLSCCKIIELHVAQKNVFESELLGKMYVSNLLLSYYL